MFKFNFKIEISDVLLILGIIVSAIGIYLIYKPAALIFIGLSMVILAFMIAPKNKDEGGGK